MASGSGRAQDPNDAGEYTYVSGASGTACPCVQMAATYVSKGWRGTYESGGIKFDNTNDPTTNLVATHTYTVFANPVGAFSDNLCLIDSMAFVVVTGSIQGTDQNGVTVSCTNYVGRIERTGPKWTVVLEGLVTLSTSAGSNTTKTTEVRNGNIDVLNCTTPPSGFPPTKCPSDNDEYVAVDL